MQPTLAPVQFQPIINAAADEGDDWGDFQAFSASGPSSAPPASVGQSQSIGCRLIFYFPHDDYTHQLLLHSGWQVCRMKVQFTDLGMFN